MNEHIGSAPWTALRIGRIALAIAVSSAWVVGACDAATPFEPEARGVIESLPTEPGPHWVWVSDMVWFAMPDGRATLVDGDSGQMLGMVSTGYSFNSLSIPRHFTEFYAAETYYSRYTRGDRTDVVTIYDAISLSPMAEIAIPPKRASTTPMLSTAALTDDDRFLAIFNFTGAQSLSIVDLRRREFIDEIPIPGCALAFPIGKRELFSICGDGTLMLSRLNDAGQLVVQNVSEKFFDVTTDPLIEKGVRLGSRWFFVTYEGTVHAVDFATGAASFLTPWSIVADGSDGGQWRIGGIQPLAVNDSLSRLFVLMHMGPKDSHHEAGSEVWVFDLARGKRLQRIKLVVPATSIQVSQDTEPLLFAVHPDRTDLVVYDARTGEHRRTLTEISITPSLLQLPVRED